MITCAVAPKYLFTYDNVIDDFSRQGVTFVILQLFYENLLNRQHKNYTRCMVR